MMENDAPEMDAQTLKALLSAPDEIALLDVREHGQYGAAHLFLACSLPYSRLEIEVARLLPRRAVRIVVYDDGDGVAHRAAQQLKAMGYERVQVLAGGVGAWRDAGYQLFAGVHVPSKTFGELVELTLHTPHISAQDLHARLEAGDDVAVLDGRPFTEFRKMNIPGAVCCPNGELALRIHQLVPNPQTTIVINCAGRTRSIIGAQTLINMGVPNPVLALENGTQGWYLQDLQLEHGAGRKHDLNTDAAALPELRARARALAERSQVRTLDEPTLQQWLADPERTTYVCDVRTPEEFRQGTLAGAQHAPGGQLIQATDLYAAVHGARFVLIDDEQVRAPVVASWLAQMGWEVALLQRADTTEDSARFMQQRWQPRVSLPQLPTLDGASLAELLLSATPALIDVRAGMRYRAGHLKGAVWSIRPRLQRLRLDPAQPVVLIADEPAVAQLAADELIGLGHRDIRLHTGTPELWRDLGLTVEATPDSPSDADCIDYLFFVHDRHDGNKQAARQYLAWEINLLNQIDAQEKARYRIVG